MLGSQCDNRGVMIWKDEARVASRRSCVLWITMRYDRQTTAAMDDTRACLLCRVCVCVLCLLLCELVCLLVRVCVCVFARVFVCLLACLFV